MKLMEKARLAPGKYTAFLALGLSAVIGGPFAAYENGLFDRSAKTILADIQQFESCSLSYNIDENALGKTGRKERDMTVLNCDLSAEQRKAENVTEAVQLHEKLQEEVAGLTKESKKEISDKIIARNARVDPETAIAQIAINSTSHHFESCEITKKADKNTMECIVNQNSATDPKVTAVIEESFHNMNIRLAQLDNNSVNKLAEKIKEVRSKELRYKFADSKGNKPL